MIDVRLPLMARRMHPFSLGQRVASRRDEVAVVSLQRLMLAIDADAEGSISRSELRTK